MVKEYRTEMIKKKIPISFQCDVCKKIIKLKNDYDKEYKNQAADHMAVVKYSYPTGGWGESVGTSKIHCCSIKCLTNFIPKIPFTATITIPSNDDFKRS